MLGAGHSSLSLQKGNDELKTLVKNNIPTEEYIKSGTQIAEKFLNKIKEDGKFKVSRVIYAGSIGKKTTIMNSDFDCVIFINEEEPPFIDVLKHWEKILSPYITTIRKTKFSLQFEYNCYALDFLPATNFIVDSRITGDSFIDALQEKALDKIKENRRENRYAYSSALAEAQICFMKKQDGFVNDMVRLAKYWYASLFFDDYISGAKTMIELVMVYAVEKSVQKTHVFCFTKFLQLLKNIHNVNIQFEKEHKFRNHPIMDHIKKQRPIVLEPTNPYNNLAKYWKAESKTTLQTYAAITFSRVERAFLPVFTFLSCNVGKDYTRMDVLFQPQHPRKAPVKRHFKDQPFLCGFEVGKTDEDISLRNNRLKERPEFENDLYLLNRYLRMVIKGYAVSEEWEKKKGASQPQINQALDNIIRKHTQCGSSVRKTFVHENQDLTISIQFKYGDLAGFGRISWSQNGMK